jgi:hypothetical protein
MPPVKRIGKSSMDEMCDVTRLTIERCVHDIAATLGH